MKKNNTTKLITKNKQVSFEYHILERYTAGIILTGSEVKSIKGGNVNLKEAYCYIDNKNEMHITNMHISEYKRGGKYNNHKPFRVRKLLLTKKEILELKEKTKQKGLTIAPVCIILSDTGLIKVEIALVRGKKNYDKREAIKEKDLKRDMEKNF